MDPAFMDLMDEMRHMLQQVWRTDNEMTLAASGTGSAGAQMLMDNLVEPGDTCLIGVNGVFGGRLTDKAQRAGGDVTNLTTDWGTAFDLDHVIEKVHELKPTLVCLVHAETSTGVSQPVAGIAEAVHEYGGLFVLDCVTSLSGSELEIDKWGVDAAYSGTQKCLSCPPGLAPVTLSERAMHKVHHRKHKPNSWYLDLNLVGNYWKGDRAYHHTAPVNMNYALHESLRLALEEGLENRWERHRRVHDRLRTGLAEMGITYLTDPAVGLPQLNAVYIPEGVDDKAVRGSLLKDDGIELGGGLGPLAGKIWRIGLMGYSASDEKVDRVLSALRTRL
jgi:alanine-glyoxylate transaminase/serine-glyoxylate transaminase/serine-pyruvate transaminase